MTEIKQLKHFLAVVEEGNFGRASIALNLSQPALSRSIQKLEDRLGCQLINRLTKGISLTPQGEITFEHAKQIVSASHTLAETVKQIDNLEAGTLNIGTGPFPATEMVPRILAKLLDDYPKLQVNVNISDSATLYRQLTDNQVELFIADVRELHDNPSLCITRLPSQKVVAACRPKHPLLDKNKVEFTELVNYPIAGVHLPSSVENGIKRLTKREQALSLQCDNLSFVIKLVEQSKAICMAPIDTLDAAFQSGRLKEIVSLSKKIKQHSAYGIIFKKDHKLSPAARALINCIETRDNLGTQNKR